MIFTAEIIFVSEDSLKLYMITIYSWVSHCIENLSDKLSKQKISSPGATEQ